MATRLPRHPHRARTEPLRIWPFIVAGALVLLAFNAANLAYQLGWLGGEPNLARQIAKASLNPGPAALVPIRADVPVYRHNLQFGNPAAGTVLTIFTDPACAPCRKQINDILANLPLAQLRLVYKIWPTNPADPTIGILTQLAARTGHIEAFWRRLNQSNRTFSSTELLAQLEAAGLPLSEQQATLTNQTEDYLINLEQDFALARKLKLGPPPQFILNDYQIDGNLLTAENLPLYVSRVQTAQPLVQSGDYWLNP